jgi:hypothetical protein
MTIYIGPNKWWWTGDTNIPNELHYACLAKVCPVGTATRDGARLICKAGGVGWFVAPSSTQVTGQWAGGQYNSTVVGNKCCISEWVAACNALIAGGVECVNCWFVPSGGSGGQLNNPGYVCRTNWDSFDAAIYWSSTERNAANACYQSFFNGFIGAFSKSFSSRVRAFRCVTY